MDLVVLSESCCDNVVTVREDETVGSLRKLVGESVAGSDVLLESVRMYAGAASPSGSSDNELSDDVQEIRNTCLEDGGAIRVRFGWKHAAPRAPALYTSPVPPPRGCPHFRSLACSPCGTRLYSSHHDAYVRIWDTESGTFQECLHFPGRVTALAVSLCGQRIYVACSGARNSLNLYDSADREMAVSQELPPASSLLLSPCGTSVVSGCADGCVRLWDSRDLGFNSTLQLQLPQGTPPAPIVCLAQCAPSQKVYAAHDDGVVAEWCLGALQCERVISCGTRLTGLAANRGEIYAMAATGMLQVWDTESSRRVRNIPSHAAGRSLVLLSPCGRHIYTAGRRANISNGGCVSMRCAASKRCCGALGIGGPPVAMCLSPCGGYLFATTSEDRVAVEKTSCIQGAQPPGLCAVS